MAFLTRAPDALDISLLFAAVFQRGCGSDVMHKHLRKEQHYVIQEKATLPPLFLCCFNNYCIFLLPN